MNSLYIRELEMRKTNSLVFFLNPSKKGKKGCPLSRNLYTRARYLTANAKKREGKKRSKSIAYLYLHAFVCAFYSREFFFLSCVCAFCLRALGFEDILLSRFQNARYFSIFLLFFRRNCAKGGNAERKRRHEVMKESGVFFVFWRERFVCCFAQKHTDMNHHVLCKGGGRGRSTRFRGFLLRPTTITSKLRVLLLLLLLKKELTTTRCKNKHPPRQRT